MGAIKLEDRIAIVIEFLRLPTRWRVTAAAIGFVGRTGSRHGGELPSMIILVASRATKRQIGELEGRARFFVFPVAGAASRFFVASIEREFGLGVIEICLAPGFHGVAELAAIFRCKFIDLTFMRVFMASNAACAFKIEAGEGEAIGAHNPGMTGYAGNSQMAASQLEFGLLMLIESELGGRKAVHGVALLAGTFGLPRDKPSPMIILVTGGAALITETLKSFPGQVAFIAGNRGMLALEREMSLRMIEISFDDALPAGGVMTPLA
jgi:hypothetical protein